MAKIIKIHKDDNVAVAIEELKQGDAFTVNGEELRAVTDVPFYEGSCLFCHRRGNIVHTAYRRNDPYLIPDADLPAVYGKRGRTESRNGCPCRT